MSAAAEAHVIPRVGAIEPQRIGVVDPRGVPVGRRPQQHEAIACPKRDRAKLAVATDRTVVELERGLEPGDLLDENRDEIGVASQPLGELRILGESPGDRSDERRRRLASGSEQDRRDPDRFVGRDVAGLDAARQPVEERRLGVVAELGPCLLEMPFEILPHPCRLAREDDQLLMAEVAGEDVAAHHRPGAVPAHVAIGQPEDLRHDASRVGFATGMKSPAPPSSHVATASLVHDRICGSRAATFGGVSRRCTTAGCTACAGSSAVAITRLAGFGGSSSVGLRESVRTADEDAGQVRGEVLFALECFVDQVPCGDEMNPAVGDARYRALAAEPRVEGIRVVDRLAAEDLVEARGVRRRPHGEIRSRSCAETPLPREPSYGTRGRHALGAADPHVPRRPERLRRGVGPVRTPTTPRPPLGERRRKIVMTQSLRGGKLVLMRRTSCVLPEEPGTKRDTLNLRIKPVFVADAAARCRAARPRRHRRALARRTLTRSTLTRSRGRHRGCCRGARHAGRCIDGRGIARALIGARCRDARSVVRRQSDRRGIRRGLIGALVLARSVVGAAIQATIVQKKRRRSCPDTRCADWGTSTRRSSGKR